jgi:hypothetical protein
MVFVSQN